MNQHTQKAPDDRRAAKHRQREETGDSPARSPDSPAPETVTPDGPTSSADAPPRNRWLVLAIVLSAVFMQLLDTTITTVAVPSIQSDLAASFGEVQLVLAGYTLAFACVLITAGRLGDIYGRKKLFVVGMVGFTLASAACGAAPSPNILIAARVAQGLCSGLMFPQVLSILQVTFPEQERSRALAMYGATIGLATILGPVLGGALIDLNLAGSDWRSIFYVNLPIGVVALTLAVRHLRESRAPQATRLDLPGAGIVTAGLLLLVLPLVVGRDEGWPAWSFAMLAASVPVLVGFVLYERGRTRAGDASALLPMHLFGQRSFSVGLVLTLIFFAGVPSFFFIFMLSLQAGFGYSAVAAGTVTLGFAVAVAVGSARSSAASKRLGTYVLAVGCGLLVVGELGVIVTLHALGTDLHGYLLIPALVVGGAGAGLFLAPVTNIILAGVRGQDTGPASGVLATMQQVGASIGIAVVGVLFFGLLGVNGQRSSDAVVPRLRSDLAAAHVTAPVADRVVGGFQVCFDDRAHAKDPAAVPASCTAILRQVATSPAPPATKAAVGRAVSAVAVPEARRHDFSRTLQQALFWQVGAFALSFVLVMALPKVKPTEGAVHGA